MSFLSDSFTDLAGTALNSHTGETGATWTKHPSYSSGSLVVTDANRIRTNATGNSAYYASGTPATAEYDVTGVLHIFSGAESFGLCGRMSTSQDTHYLAWATLGTGKIELYVAVNGSYTLLQSVSQTWTVGNDYTIKLQIRDAAKKVFINGTEVISSADNSVTAAGRAGVRAESVGTAATNSTQSHLDSITATDAVTRTAQTYYIDASAGADTNDGLTTGTAWQTIGKANSYGLVAGDTLLLKGGQTHSGSLLIDTVSTSAMGRIRVGSYGSGRPTINPSTSYGVKINNTGYVTVSGIDIAGPGISVSGTYPSKTATTTSTQPGIAIEATTTGTWYSGVRVHDVTVDGCEWGIRLYSTNASATAAYRNVRITSCGITNCGVRGITSYGTNSTAGMQHVHIGILYQRVYVADCKAENIRGITAFDYGTGSAVQNGDGIVLWNCQDSTIERCYAHVCGEASPNTTSGGPGAFYFVECSNCIVRDCEADTIYGPEGVDGCGFDIDGGCSSCRVERCLARNCDGPGILAGQVSGLSTWSSNQFRFCIVENCGRVNVAGGFRAFGGTSGQITIAHCTFYHQKATSGPASLLSGSDTVAFVNNIFSVSNGGTFGGAGSSSTFAGNCYHVGSGSSFSLAVGSTYTSLTAMQAASFETVSGVAVGVQADPGVSSAGGGTAQWPTYGTPIRLTAYDITTASAAATTGVDPLEVVSIDVGSSDYHARPARAVTAFDLSGYASGAIQPATAAYVPQAGGTPTYSRGRVVNL